MSSTPPTTIGRYEVEKELEQGGQGVVYLALDPYIKRQVAIKLLPRQLTLDPEFLSRFHREAEIVASLEHACIVPIYDFGEHEGQPYIVMRYMPGGSLEDRLGDGPLALSDVADIVDRVALALDVSHKRNVIHRDIKPGNILFDTGGQAFLSDYGIAKMADSLQTGQGQTGGVIVGTPEYMSPEQVQGQKLDARSDVYSLGIVIFESLAAELPFKAKSPMMVALAHLNEAVPSLAAVNNGLPRQCDDLIYRALAKDRVDRFQSAGELAEWLRLLASGRGYMLKLSDL